MGCGNSRGSVVVSRAGASMNAESNNNLHRDEGLKQGAKFDLTESLRFEDEDQDEDEDEPFCFRHNEIIKIFRLQLGRDDEQHCHAITVTDLSMCTMSKSSPWSSFSSLSSSSSSNLKLANCWISRRRKHGGFNHIRQV